MSWRWAMSSSPPLTRINLRMSSLLRSLLHSRTWSVRLPVRGAEANHMKTGGRL